MTLKKILVVDDEAATLLAFKKLLQQPGFEVHIAESLEDAMACMNENTYSGVIADFRLSGTLGQEGFKIIETARKNFPSSKIALITAYGSHGIKDQAIQLGADFYFEKPVSIQDLHQILDSIRLV